MIFTRWGHEVEISAYCGKHILKGHPLPLVLCRVQYKDDGRTGYQFATFLKADGGYEEIASAIDWAPEVVLDDPAAAIADAS